MPFGTASLCKHEKHDVDNHQNDCDLHEAYFKGPTATLFCQEKFNLQQERTFIKHENRVNPSVRFF